MPNGNTIEHCPEDDSEIDDRLRGLSQRAKELTEIASSLEDSMAARTDSTGHSWPTIGEHLVTSRGIYEHHGLSLGDGWVIHRSGYVDKVTDGTVCRVTLTEFENGNGFRVRPHRYRRYSPAESVARALSKEGEAAYSVAFNNCEHFVNWCVDGQHQSDQVRSAVDAFPILGAVALALGAIDKAKSVFDD